MADFQSRIEDFKRRNVTLIGASVDPLEEARKTMARLKLSYPLAYGLEARDFSDQTGAFFDEEKNFLQAAGFIIRADGIVAAAVYSTGPVGRYVAADCIGLIDYLSKQTG